MATLIPVLKLKTILDGLIEYVRVDFESRTNEADTFLFKALAGNRTDGYDFYEEAKNIFLRTSTSSRKIETRIMFTKDIAPTPTIFVREPAREKGIYNSIGSISGTRINLPNNQYTDEYRDTKKAAFEYMITSDNPLETVLVAEVLYNLLLGAWETLQTQWFDLFDFSLKELVANNELIPYPLYIKAVEITVQFSNTVPGVQLDTLINAINFADPTLRSEF